MIHQFWSKKVKIIKNNKIIKLLFKLIFSTYLPRFYSNFKWEYLLDAKFNSSSKEYPCCTLLMNLSTRKVRNTWKTWFQSFFSCISYFSCSTVHQKYATWVLLRWGIKCFIQRVYPLEIWVKTVRDKLKIRVEKVVLLFYFF